MYLAFAPALPLLAVLLSLALVPQLWPRLWHDPKLRGCYLAALVLPVVANDMSYAKPGLVAAAEEYVAFVVLLGCLFAAAACVSLEGDWRATTGRNTLLLATGACLASLVGTTGASMLLVRPLLRSNAKRRYQRHTVVFFIFLVSNVGGLLLPLGDPPLFLGYLRGVPFFWTLRLWPAWLCICAALLALYAAIDGALLRREGEGGARRTPTPPTPLAAALAKSAGLKLRGGQALVAFVALPTIMVGAGPAGIGFWGQQVAMLAVTAAVFLRTPRDLLASQDFSWQPMVEVAQVFAAIFAAMPAALRVLAAHHDVLPLGSPTAFFWWSGSMSAVLDNAPCYATFATLAAKRVGLPFVNLAALAVHPQGATYLEAIALGSVTMGAVTYVGNGPNLMVRSIAQGMGLKTPSFFGYVAWSSALLLPVLACTHWLLYIALR